jgi:hypothetical protein
MAIQSIRSRVATLKLTFPPDPTTRRLLGQRPSKLGPSFPQVRDFLGVVPRLAYAAKQAPSLLFPPAQYWVPKSVLRVWDYRPESRKC